MTGVNNADKENRRNMRKFLYSCNTALILLIVVALGVIINLLAARFNLRFDLTANQIYSLSEQSIQVLKELQKYPGDVRIYGFFRDGDQARRQVESLLNEYKNKCRKIRYQFIDPVKQPVLARQYQVQEERSLVMHMGEKKLSVFFRDLFQQSYNAPPQFTGEQAVTRTFAKIIEAETKNIYFLVGHGEKEYRQAMEYIRGEGYGVINLNLMRDGKIPDNCGVLIIAGPQTDLPPQEIKLIEEYMNRGGRLMIFLDFAPKKSSIPRLVSFLKNRGIDTEDGVVIELERNTLFDASVIIPVYQTHEITNKLSERNTNLLFPGNRGLIRIKDYSGNAETSTILESSPHSWIETGRQIKQDSGETKGPIPLGIAAIDRTAAKENRLVALGCSAFLDDNFVYQAGNLNLFYNMTQWLLGQEDRITITPKSVDLDFVRDIKSLQGNLISLFCLIILPVVIALIGLVIWIRRRAR
ncbi:MAG: GldG family protein [Bacillota bacterium]